MVIICPSFAREEIMNWEEYSRIILDKCINQRLPYHACFELTPFCNFRCNMCYVRLDNEQAKGQGDLLTTEEWIQMAQEAKKMGTLSLEVTGGEAVTRPDFPILMETFVKLGFIINLRTNGYLIEGERLELLKKYKPHRIGITIYGASNDTYKRICGIPDGFSVVTGNILKLKEEGFDLHLSMMVTQDNIDDRKALNEWAEANDLSIIPHGGMINPIRNAERKVDHLRVDYSDEDCDLSDIIQSGKNEILNRESYLNPFWMCKGYGAMFCISWDGRMTLCNTMTAVWQDPRKHGVEKAYHNLYSELDKLKRPIECETCDYIEYCASCPSQLLSETGSPSSTCEGICRRARHRFKSTVMRGADKS